MIALLAEPRGAAFGRPEPGGGDPPRAADLAAGDERGERPLLVPRHAGRLSDEGRFYAPGLHDAKRRVYRARRDVDARLGPQFTHAAHDLGPDACSERCLGFRP